MTFPDFQAVLLCLMAAAMAPVLAAACLASARLGFGWMRGLLVALPLVQLWALRRASLAGPRPVAEMGPSRRAVLHAALLAAAGGAAATAAVLVSVDPLARRLAGILPPEVDPQAVARAYLEQPGAAWAARQLAGRLAAGLPPAAVADWVRADFASQTVVVADGWVLAATEAQLCVLLAEGGDRRVS